jgi:cold shock CspA family protein
LIGKCVHYNHAAGYGKIVGEDNETYFVHCSALPYEDRVRGMDYGQKVEFHPELHKKGLRALRVRLLEDSTCRLNFDGRSNTTGVLRNEW